MSEKQDRSWSGAMKSPGALAVCVLLGIGGGTSVGMMQVADGLRAVPELVEEVRQLTGKMEGLDRRVKRCLKQGKKRANKNTIKPVENL